MEYRKTITLEEANQFVNDVVEGCFIDGVYSPLMKDLLLNQYAVLYFAPEFYADKELSITEFWESMFADEEVSSLIQEISFNEQFFAIERAIDKQIAFELEKFAHPLDLELAKFVEKISSMVDNLGSIFTEDTITKIMPALENIGKLTDIKQEDVVKEIVSSLKPARKKTTKPKTTKAKANSDIKIADKAE